MLRSTGAAVPESDYLICVLYNIQIPDERRPFAVSLIVGQKKFQGHTKGFGDLRRSLIDSIGTAANHFRNIGGHLLEYEKRGVFGRFTASDHRNSQKNPSLSLPNIQSIAHKRMFVN